MKNQDNEEYKEKDEDVKYQEDEDIENQLYDFLRPPQDATEDIDNLESLNPECLQSCFFVGLTPEINRYFYERPRKNFQKGNYHALIPLDEMNILDSWRKAHRGKTRGKLHLYQWNLTFEKWLENDIDKKDALMARRDKNGWFPMDLQETFSYHCWCQSTWQSLQSKFQPF